MRGEGVDCSMHWRLALLLALLSSLAARCSSAGTEPETDAVAPLDWAAPADAPLDWSQAEADAPAVDAPDPADADAPRDVAADPSDAQRPDTPEADAPPDAPDATVPPDPAADGDDVHEIEPVPEPLGPEPLEVQESEPDPEVDTGPEVTPCASSQECEPLPHGACPGWWTCDGTCAWTCPAPLDLYDLADLEDDQQLFAEILSETDQTADGQNFRVREVRFRSFEWVSGEKVPIAIHGYVAHPQVGAPVKPGVLLLKGLEGLASADDAMSLAGRVDAIVLVLDGPGMGGSLGTGPTTGLQILFATEPDPRAPWFVAYAVAASRGLTWLREQPAVQPTRLGVVGRRLGGVVALLVNGIDRRVKACVAIEAAGAIPVSARQGGWFASMLSSAGLAPYAAAVDLWASRADPLAYAPLQRSPVLLVVGAQDEYFPLPTVLSTYAALTVEKRLALIGDWDALWYAGATGQQNTYDNSARAEAVIRDDTTAWLRHHLAADAAYPLPAEPLVAREVEGLTSRFHATCAEGADSGTARVLISSDAAFTFPALALSATGPGSWSAPSDLLAAIYDDTVLVYFSEVSVPVGPAGSGRTLVLTSVPHTPPGFVPVVRSKPW